MVFLVLGIGSAAADIGVHSTERWFRILDQNGQVLGRVHETVIVRPDGTESVAEQEMRFKVSGHSPTHLLTRTSRLENLEGETVRLRIENLAGNDGSIAEVSVDGGVAEITRITRHGQRRSRAVLPENTRFDTGESLLREWTWDDGRQLRFYRFDPVELMVERVVLQWDGEDVDGGMKKIVRKAYDGDDLRSVSILLLNADGQVVRLTQSLLGGLVSIEPSETKVDASALSAGRIIDHQMVPSPYRISSPAKVAHIRYRFGFRDGMSFSMPETGQQRVTSDGDGITVDVCDRCGPGLPAMSASLEKWTQPADWLESDSPDLQKAAGPIAALQISDCEKMLLLVRRARTRMSKFDYDGHYSALDAWHRRAGDCTEDAVVLAALGRAAGIPTRVANGLVYSRATYHGVANAFMPHSWTLAYVDGAWETFDMSLDGFDATHIAITVSDGDARSVMAANQLINLLEWRAFSQVKSRQEP